MFLARGGTATIVTGPSPKTWKARLTSPLRAYLVRGTERTSPVEQVVEEISNGARAVALESLVRR